MNIFLLPWTELTILLPLAGGLIVTAIRDTKTAGYWTLGTMALTLVACLMALLGFYSPSGGAEFHICDQLFQRKLFHLDQFSAPLPSMVAILHLLTVLATSRVKRNRMSFAGHLFGESVRLATFACIDPLPLIVLLALGVAQPFVELRRRGKPTKIFVLHMGAFLILLTAGWIFVEMKSGLGPILLLFAVLLRSGIIPGHLWVSHLFEHASFGTALLFVTPITGMYAAVRLVLPVAPDGILWGIGLVSLLTAVYSAGMAIVQQDARRFFAYLFLSHASLVLVGLELHTATTLTGALCLWVSVALSLGGLGLTIRALEARFGRLTLTENLGLYQQSPTLAVGFLLTGLASIGFPGTLGFVATEMIIDGAVTANPIMGLVMVFAAMLNSIAVIRAYTLLFTGKTPRTNLLLAITPGERIAVLVLAALVLLGGLWPNTGVVNRSDSANKILEQRDQPNTVSNAPSPS